MAPDAQLVRLALDDDLPRTFSGKLVELAVADAVNGRVVGNRDSIANPQAVDAIAAALE